MRQTHNKRTSQKDNASSMSSIHKNTNIFLSMFRIAALFALLATATAFVPMGRVSSSRTSVSMQ